MGRSRYFSFDPIGNRTQTARDGDTEIYTANNLNQYTERTVPGVAHLAGTAAEDAVVTINRPSISGITVEPVTRQGAYFHKKLALDNSAGADVEEIAVVGVKAGAHSTSSGQVDIVSSYSGVVWAAQSPECFSYDDDGNMLADALRRYEWDAENRLIAVTVSNVVDGYLTRVEMAYDYMNRRSLKKVFEWVNGQWSMVSSRSFLYDGWNLISEVCAATGKGTITDYYIWGLDLSGSLQGAGGIGGLVGRVRSENRYYDEQGMLLICHKPPGNPENEQTLRINESAWPAHSAHGDTLGACAGGSVSNSAFLYTFDGNGNVSELLLSSVVGPLASVAHYEYSPFGETIVSAGPEAQDNPIRFSTKPAEENTGLVLYEYRPYSPSLGRFLVRDPIFEVSTDSKNIANVFRAFDNNPINASDNLGLMTTTRFAPYLEHDWERGCNLGSSTLVNLFVVHGWPLPIVKKESNVRGGSQTITHWCATTAGGIPIRVRLCNSQTTIGVRIVNPSSCKWKCDVSCTYTYSGEASGMKWAQVHPTSSFRGSNFDTPRKTDSGTFVRAHIDSWSDKKSDSFVIDPFKTEPLGTITPNSLVDIGYHRISESVSLSCDKSCKPQAQ